jgi:hypothetical protein
MTCERVHLRKLRAQKMRDGKDPYGGDHQEDGIEEDLPSGYAAFEYAEVRKYRTMNADDESTQRS